MKPSRRSASNISTNNSIWAGERSISEATASLAVTIGHLRQSLHFVSIWTLVFIAASILYTHLLVPEFIASTHILLQPRVIINDGPENLRHFYQFIVDGDECETELRVLTSERLLHRVFEIQNLSAAPEIQAGADGLWAFIRTQLDRIKQPAPTDTSDIRAFNSFIERVRARRLGLSYVIEISYRAHSAKQATKVVNAIASTYAAYRLRSVMAREQRRGAYLESRLLSLSKQILAAEEGGRLGVIPEGGLFDSDVRLLGPANLPLGVAYPRLPTLMMMMGGFGLVSGLLLALLSRGAIMRHTEGEIFSAAK